MWKKPHGKCLGISTYEAKRFATCDAKPSPGPCRPWLVWSGELRYCAWGMLYIAVGLLCVLAERWDDPPPPAIRPPTQWGHTHH